MVTSTDIRLPPQKGGAQCLRGDHICIHTRWQGKWRRSLEVLPTPTQTQQASGFCSIHCCSEPNDDRWTAWGLRRLYSRWLWDGYNSWKRRQRRNRHTGGAQYQFHVRPQATWRKKRQSIGWNGSNHATPVLGKIRSITTDNGSEFAEHLYIVKRLKNKIFFAHPYSSWEKGCAKNITTNSSGNTFLRGQTLILCPMKC